jgi:tRNA-Thr(GGU) m(6)t(6)A37 methyltransferase TsaA
VLNVLRRLVRYSKKEDAPRPAPVTLQPVGIVRNKVPVPQAYDFDWRKVESRIVIHSELTDALLGLSAYSHVLVLFLPHQVPEEVRGSKHQLHLLDDERNPLQGILATRSQIRFNPVLVTAARLLNVKRNVVTVRGLDAVSGSPVLDIKPYIAYFDSVPDATTPAWLAEAAERRREAADGAGERRDDRPR